MEHTRGGSAPFMSRECPLPDSQSRPEREGLGRRSPSTESGEPGGSDLLGLWVPFKGLRLEAQAPGTWESWVTGKAGRSTFLLAASAFKAPAQDSEALLLICENPCGPWKSVWSEFKILGEWLPAISSVENWNRLLWTHFFARFSSRTVLSTCWQGSIFLCAPRWVLPHVLFPGLFWRWQSSILITDLEGQLRGRVKLDAESLSFLLGWKDLEENLVSLTVARLRIQLCPYPLL